MDLKSCALAAGLVLLGVNSFAQSSSGSTDATTSPNNISLFSGQSADDSQSASFGAKYDDVIKSTVWGQYARKFNSYFALGGLVDIGENEYRGNLTAAFRLTERDIFSIGAEHLNQTLSYDFNSGAVDQSVKQNAFGVQAQHKTDNSVFQQLIAKAYTVKAQGVDLSSVTYTSDDGTQYLEDRHIAPGQVSGFSLGSDAHLGQTTLANFSGGIDYSKYDTYYSDNSTTRAFASEVSLLQRLTDTSHIELSAANHPYYDTYKAQINFSPLKHFSCWQFYVSAERLIAGDISSGNSNTFGLGVNLLSDDATKTEDALFNKQSSETDLLSTVSSPLVYFDRVLTKVDQNDNAINQVENPTLTGCSYDGGSQTLTCAGQNLLQLGDASNVYRHFTGSSCSLSGGIYNSTPQTYTNNAYVVSPVGLMGTVCNISLCNNNTCSDKETNSVFITGT